MVRTALKWHERARMFGARRFFAFRVQLAFNHSCGANARAKGQPTISYNNPIGPSQIR